LESDAFGAVVNCHRRVFEGDEPHIVPDEIVWKSGNPMNFGLLLHWRIRWQFGSLCLFRFDEGWRSFCGGVFSISMSESRERAEKKTGGDV
jgi:hypothetical protein